MVTYLRLALAGLWFFVATLIAFCLLPFRWKNPTLGATLGRLISWGGSRIMGWTIRIENQAGLHAHQPCVFVANHQSNLDIISLGATYPANTVVIGKKSLRWVPLFGLIFVGTGMILIDRKRHDKAIESLDAARDALLKDGRSIWVFCEGTRNRGRGLLPFKKGAFHIAISAQVPIVPIVAQHLFSYFDLARREVTPGEILIRVLEPVPTRGLTHDDLPTLMADVRRRMTTELAKPELKQPLDLPGDLN